MGQLMFTYFNAKPPEDVVSLVKEFKENRGTRELLINDGFFLLFEKVEETPEQDGQPRHVQIGKMIRRAYWPDAGTMTLDMVKAKLGL